MTELVHSHVTILRNIYFYSIVSILFQWLFDQRPIVSGGNYYIHVDGLKTHLDIEKVGPEHYGEYICHVMNTEGEAGFPILLMKPGTTITVLMQWSICDPFYTHTFVSETGCAYAKSHLHCE